jgi:hypothetical protein
MGYTIDDETMTLIAATTSAISTSTAKLEAEDLLDISSTRG